MEDNDDNGESARTLPPRNYSMESSSYASILPCPRHHYGHAGTFLFRGIACEKTVTIQEIGTPYISHHVVSPVSSVSFDPAIYESFQAVRCVNPYPTSWLYCFVRAPQHLHQRAHIISQIPFFTLETVGTYCY